MTLMPVNRKAERSLRSIARGKDGESRLTILLPKVKKQGREMNASIGKARYLILLITTSLIQASSRVNFENEQRRFAAGDEMRTERFNVELLI